jgi:protein O-GlcNAc transferase
VTSEHGPGNGVSTLELAVAQFGSNDLKAAEATARAHLATHPADANALNILGVICKRTGRLAEAIDSFRRAVESESRHLPALLNLGRAYEAQGDFAPALQALEAARQAWPKDAELLAQIGWIHHRLGAPARARAACGEALAIDPDSATAHANLGLILLSGGEIDAALVALERAVAIAPDRIEVLRALGMGLAASRKFVAAVPVYRRILALLPGDAGALLDLANAYAALDDLPRADDAYRAAIAAAPDNLAAVGRLCLSLLASRSGDEAANAEEAARLAHAALASGRSMAPIFSELQTVFERLADFDGLARLGDPFAAAAANPGMAPHGLFSRVESASDRHRLIALHRDWGRRVADGVRDKLPARPRPPRRRKLRIGLVSSDLRSHPIAYFALPLLQHYDRAAIELFCYSFFPGADEVQSHIAAMVDRFALLPDRTDAQAARLIAEDDPDLLFELGGFTKFNRLELFANRMAPIQASWLGYPHSAGLPTLDRILVDPYVKPPDPDLLIEQPFELPESWVSFGHYGFFDIAIDAAPPFLRRGGRISFGTMNQPAKFTPACIAAWAKVLDRTDGARFVIVRPEANAPVFRDNLAREFARHGIAADRLAFIANQRGQQLALYNEIDIALDPFPQTGGTTTCESLWMGVPVVSLVGPAFFERLSFSNLSNAGLGDLCSDTVADYIDKAVALAGDAQHLQDLRRALRDRLRRSPLCQTERWVRNFEAAARAVAR